MAKRPAPYRVYDRDGIAWLDVRSVAALGRVRESLGVAYADRGRRGPSRAAQEAAAQRFEKLVSGRVTAPADRVLTLATDEELVAMWLDAIETAKNKKSVGTKTVYGRTWHAFFSDDEHWGADRRTPLERMVHDGGPSDYVMHRLSHVLRKTVRKEVSALFGFYAWAKLHGHIASVPPRPELPRGETGVRSGPQRAKPVDITASEARRIIAALPEWSKAADREPRKGQTAFRVRDVFAFMWEMTWRPSTLARISVPENWYPGATTLTLHDADDKARYGREVTLTKAAKAILERCAPVKGGLVFGEHDYRAYIKAAAKKVLPKAKADNFARYDIRHGRINNLLDMTGNLLGTAQIAGHRQLTTTNAYLRGQKRQGDAVIAAADLAVEDDDEDTMRAHSETTDEESPISQSGREDSNLRPLDPQRTEGTQQPDSAPPDAREDTAKTGEDPPGRDKLGARSGHVPPAVLRAQRALLIQTEVARSFDAVFLDTDGVEW